MENRVKHLRKSYPDSRPSVRQTHRWEERMRSNAVPTQQPIPSHEDAAPPENPVLRSVPLHSEEEVAAPDAHVERASCPPCHWGLLGTTLLLTGLSIPLVYSASTAFALNEFGNNTFFLVRQVIFALIGVAAMVGVSRLSRKQVIAVGWVLFALTVLGLIATKWTPLGSTSSEASGNVARWLKLGPLRLQVSELAKVALLLVLAHYWSLGARSVRGNWGMKPWIISLVLTLPIVLLVLLQPHLSAAGVLLLLPLIVGFFAGAPARQMGKVLLGLGVLSAVVVGLSYFGKIPLIKPYQQERIARFFSHDKEKQAGDYQKYQALRAIWHGGLLGVGPGNSLYKQGHLPAPHTDYILAITGEEWGLVGMLTLLGLYGVLIFFCMQVGYNAGNMFEMLLCSGMAVLLLVQVCINMGVALGKFPVTGILLPFISYGGSGLVCLLMGMGFVLGVSRHRGMENA